MKEIMIIEDSKIYQKKISDIVSELNYQITKVFSYGEKALNHILKGKNYPDLIIIDIILKGKIDGYQVANKISSETTIPFIFLTIKKDEIDDFKASVYLNKPFSKEELKNNINLALYKHGIHKKMIKNNEETNMLLNTIDTQIWYLKNPTTYAKVNQAHANFLGFRKSDLKNKQLADIFSKKEADLCNLSNKKVFIEKKKIQTKEWLKKANGQKRLLAITKNPKINDKNKVEYVICSAEDITDQHQKEKIFKDLHKIALKFKNLKTEEEISKMTIKSAEDLLDFNLCNFLLIKKNKFIPTASSGNFQQKEISVSETSIAAKTHRENKNFIIKNLQDSQEAAKIENIYKSAISIPIGNYGVFQAAAPKINAFTEKDLELAEILISHAAAALNIIYARKKINVQKDFLSTILEVQSGLVLLLDPQGNILSFNNTCEKITGYSEAEVLGKKVWDLFIKKTEREKIRRVFHQLKTEDYPQKYENSWLTKKGEKKQISWSNNVILDDENKVRYIVGTGIDITKRKNQEQKLMEQKVYFEQLFNNSTEAIALLDKEHNVIKVNNKFESLFGFKQSKIVAKNIDNLIIPEEHLKKGMAYTEKVKKGEKVQGEVIRKNKKGDSINVYLQGLPIEMADGQIGIYALYNDITERKKKEKQVEYLSFHDEMTGLYNRRYFENELQRLNSSIKYPITILIGDLDGLKRINDNYGHKKGDQYIISAANVLKSTARNADIIARIGGDEFAVILPSTDYQEAKNFCNRVKNSISQFNENSDFIKPLSISLGFDVMENNKQSLEQVFNKADQKMYINKGRN